MDQEEIFAKLEEFRKLCLKYNQRKYSEVDHDKLARLYGALEPVIQKILGIEEIEVELSHGATSKCKNYIEAGFLTGRTMHTHIGYQQLLRVIGRVQQHPELAIHGTASNNNGCSFDPITVVENLCTRFHLVARQLRGRHDERDTLLVEDEYDVQDLLHALLTLHFDDIRPEEWTPSYAGGSSRMDFLLKKEKIVIEVKKTRKGLRAKQVGEQLLVDIQKYKQHPDCKTLLCFVYDPEARISNPKGIEADLSKTIDDILVKVLIRPTGL